MKYSAPTLTGAIHYCANTICIRYNISNFLTSEGKWRIKHHILDSICNIVLRIQKMALLRAINDFRKTVAGQIAGATMMGIAAAASVSGAAMAGDGQIRYVKTESGDSIQFIERLGGEASHGRYALVVFSDNNDILRAAYEVAQDIERDTPYDVTYIHAPAIGPISRVLVIANGIQILDAQNGGRDIAGLKQDLQTGFKRGSAQLASVDGVEPGGRS